MKKYEQYKKLVISLLNFLLMGIFAVLYIYIWYKDYLHLVINPFLGRGNIVLVLVYMVLLSLFLIIYGGYKFDVYTVGNIIFSQVLSIILANIVTYFQISLIARSLLPPRPMLIMTAIEIFIAIIWANVSVHIYRKLYPAHELLMIYGSNMVDTLVGKLEKRKDKYNIKEKIDVEVGLDKVYAKIDQYGAVILCDVKTETRNKILKYCFEHSVRTYVTPKISDIIMKGASEVKLFDTPLVVCKNAGLTFEQKFLKRLMDVVVSAIILCVTSPIMLITAIAIKLHDKGPVFFRQTRCTIHQREFEALKFRSMIVNADKKGAVALATEKDPRITPVGRIIRATRIDELPQLINVLKGEMSVVGPRAMAKVVVDECAQEIPEFAYRSKVKGGLTGYAQTVGKYNTSAYDKLKLDLMYIENYSILLDVRLLLTTVKIIFMKESTEGVETAEGEDTNEKGI